MIISNPNQMKDAFFIGIFTFLLLLLPPGANTFGVLKRATPAQKVIIIMMDGFGEEYYRNSKMPSLNFIEKHGLFKVVNSLMPSVTNVNNTSICTGELPEKHGITGNSFYNSVTGTEEFMEDSSLVLSPTIFEKAGKKGIRSALFSSKKKTITLLSRGTTMAVSPETASSEWISRIGEPPSIYSCEVNYWLMKAVLYTMDHDSSINLYYIHTTDYPMHTWSPTDRESKEHLNKIDSFLALIMKAEPGAMILITADHTVKHKNLCLDIEKACINRKMPVKIAISAERDKYVKQHRGFGGISYVYLNAQNDLPKIKKLITGLKGVEEVLTREEAAKKFHLMSGRIGDLVVLGDENTVFGNLDTEYETLPANYRTHGSIHEAIVPLFVYNAPNAPAPGFFSSNYKLAAWLYK
jgi:phosphonoacetate hydrolase